MIHGLRSMSAAELRGVLAAGHAIDPAALAGGDYLGTSLGLPGFIERLTWKIFRKVFREANDGAVTGYNVRLDQRTAEPLRTKSGAEVTFGPYAVVPLPSSGTPFRCRAGVLLDYGAKHPALHPLARVRDPLVSLHEKNADLLLGATYLAVGPFDIATPSFFALERIG